MNNPEPGTGAPSPGKLGMLVSLVPCMVAIVVAWYAIIDRWPLPVLVGAILVYLVGTAFWLVNRRKYRRHRQAEAEKEMDAGRE